MERRTFVKYSAAAGAAMMLPTLESIARSGAKIRVVQAGTGHRGTGFWGKDLVKNFGDILDYLGVYDINPGRAEYAKNLYGGIFVLTL